MHLVDFDTPDNLMETHGFLGLEKEVTRGSNCVFSGLIVSVILILARSPHFQIVPISWAHYLLCII